MISTSLPQSPFSRWFVCAVLAFVTTAVAAEADLKNCVELTQPVPLTQQASPVVSTQDIGNLTVVELSGDYDRGLILPREQVANAFYAAHPDAYDFLVVFTTFEFPTGIATAFYNPVRNDTAGIGLAPLDIASYFGSTGRLQGYVDMAAMSRYTFLPSASGYQATLGTLAHEMMHRWGAYVHFVDTHANDSTDLIGQQNAHWNYFLDTDGSVMYGADWQLQGDGKFHSVDVRHRYSSLDLYLAGFAAPSEVAPFALIRNGDGALANDFPVLGASSGGQAETITIDQVIAASGARVPSAANAQKDFTAAMILLRRPGESVSPDRLLELERFRTRFQQEFAQMTNGRSVLRIYTQQRATVVAGLPSILHGSGAPQALPGIGVAVTWLEGKQSADGHWQDRDATAMRDTVAAIRALRELDPTYPGLTSARAWVAAHGVANLDELAWKLAGADAAVDAQLLESAQDASGGFGLTSGWMASSFDTAPVANALGEHSALSPALSHALQLVGSQQNSDGSYGVVTGGRGRALPTMHAAAFAAGFGGSGFGAARDGALAWLSGKQLPDGSIGAQGQSSLIDSLEMFALTGRLRPDPALVANLRTYVVASQQRLGDWGGSIYLTATAALAYAHDQQPNLQVSGTPFAAPGQPRDGERAVLSAVVANKGSVPVPTTVARWYDGDPDQGGVQIGADLAVPPLAAASFAMIKQPWDTTSHAGEHVLWLVLDPDNTVVESSEQDNRSTLAVSVLAPSNLPDLALEATDFALSPAAVSSLPSAVHLIGTLRNIGAATANGVAVRLYATPDTTHAIASTTVDIPGRGTAPVAMNFTISAPATLNLLLRADPDNAVAEANETNNDAVLILPFGQSLDLQVTPSDVTIASATRVGQDIAFDVMLHNLGTVDSPPVVLHADIVQNNSTVVVFDAPVQILAGHTQSRRITWRASQAGPAQLRVALDPANQVAEMREDNNAAQLDFQVASMDQPELTFASDSLAFIPTPSLQGQPLVASLLVRNLSSVATGSFRVGLYAADPRSAAPSLASTVVSSVAGSSDLAVNMNVADLSLSGDQTLYAFIDSENQIEEADETNNVIIAPLRVVSLPDVVVSVADMALTPALPVPGQPVHAQVTVRNTGGQDAQNVVVRLQEGDAPSGAAVGTDQTIDLLRAGSAATLSWNWTLGVLPDSRAVTAIADPAHMVREGSEENNSATLPFDVQDGNFFVNQRYISPNGDGVQDETVIVFVLPAAGPAELDVVNGAQYTVRHFTNVQLNDALRGQVIWDGRDDLGRIVADGDYHLLAIDAHHQSHAGALVSVDNDLSSVFEAVDSPYGIYGDIPWYIDTTYIPPITSPLRDELFGIWAPEIGESRGVNRTGTLFPLTTPVISGNWLEAFRKTQQAHAANFDRLAFSPDGRNIVVSVYGSTNDGKPKLWILSTSVDRTDSPTLLASLDAFPLQVFGYFDSDTVVVGPSNEGMLLTVAVGGGGVAPLRSFADAQALFSPRAEIVPAGVLLSDNNSIAQIFLPRDPTRASSAFNSLPHTDGTDYTYFSRLSPQRTSLVVYERNPDVEKVDLIDLIGGSRTNLVQSSPWVAKGQLTGSLISVGRYGVNWLEQQDVLLIEDAAARAVLMYSEAGQQLSRTEFAMLQRIGQYSFLGAHGETTSDAAHLFADAAPDLIPSFCNFATNDALGVERRVFDPARNQLLTRFGETIVHEEQREGFGFEYAAGIRDYFSADLGTGETKTVQQGTLTPLLVSADIAQHPLRQDCSDSPPPDWPQLVLHDGARIRTDGKVQTLSRGVLPKAWPEGNDSVSALWPDETRALVGGRMFSSLLNLTAVLQARTLGRGVELYGVAADRNFASYRLDWARIEQPNVWNTLTPASSNQIFLDEFLTWVPPQPGTVLIRLTVTDKAGNHTSVIVTATSFDSSSIDSFALSPRYISPNGDGVQDQLLIAYNVRRPATLDLRITDVRGNTVRTSSVTYTNADLGAHQLVWDGRNDSGDVVPDGRYRLNLDGLAGWIVVDTAAPTVVGEIVPAYPYSVPCERPADPSTDYQCPAAVIDPSLLFAVNDQNLANLTIESAIIGSNLWSTSFECNDRCNVAHIDDKSSWIRYASFDDLGHTFANHTFRIVSTDLAGNTRTYTLGDAPEQVPLLNKFGDDLRPQLFSYDTPPYTTPLDTATLSLASVDRTAPQDYLVAYDASGRMAQIAVETSPADAQDQWTERGHYLPSDIACPLSLCSKGELHVPLAVDDLPLGSLALVRLRGDHADGTHVYSNRGYINIGGISAPECTIGGAVAREYYSGPLSKATLHFVSPQYEVESTVNLDVTEIQDGTLFFPHAAFEEGTKAWVIGIDRHGHTNSVVHSGLVSCTHGGSPPSSSWAVDISPSPIVVDQCDGQPSNQLKLNLSIGIANAAGRPAFQHGTLSYVDGVTGTKIVLLDQEFGPLYAAAGFGTKSFPFSTANWPEGTYEGRFDITELDGTSTTLRTDIPVVKVPPHVAIASPGQGEKVCALPASPGSPLGILPITGEVSSESDSSYRVELGAGASPLNFFCEFDKNLSVTSHPCPAYSMQGSLLNKSALGYLGAIKDDLRVYNGTSTIRLKAVNWSGGTVCTNSTFYLDSKVEFQERAPPQNAFSTIGGSNAVGIAPNGDPDHATGRFFLAANEPVQFAATVHRASIDTLTGALKLDAEILATLSNADRVQGPLDVTWDGRIAGGIAADALYGIAATATDGCSFTKTVSYAALLDSTAPVVALTAPLASSSIGAPVIEIIGTASDNVMLGSWSLDYALAASPTNWQNLASGTTPITTPQPLKSWSRGSLTGLVDVRLSAIDLFGNHAETHLFLTLLDPAKLIGAAELQPPLFSPNGDGALDTSRLQVGLLQVANLAITANNATLYSGPALAGSRGFVWDGKDGAGHALPDGTYPVVINATDPSGMATPETATLSATVDNTPPALTILQPTGAFAAPDALVRIQADDAHFAHYAATLTRAADNVVAASVEGTQGGDITVGSLHGFQEGTYVLHAVARDGAANVTMRDASFQIDATGPVVVLANPDDGTLVPSASVTSVKGSVNDAHLASWSMSIAPEDADTWTDLAQGSANVDLRELLAWTPHSQDGRYRLRLRGVDQAGNTTDVIHAVDVDGTAPVAHIAAPANGDVVRGSFEIDGIATDAHFASYRISVISAAQLAGGQWADVFVGTMPVDNAKMAALTLNLPDDNYVLRLLVADKVGSRNSDQVSVRIDTHPPAAPLGLIGHVENHRNAILDWNAISDADLRGYHVYRGGARITTTPVVAIHYADASAPEGRLPYYVTAVDTAGNESVPSNTVMLVVDHTPPQVALVHPVSGERVRGVYEIIGTAYSHDDFKQYRLTARQTAPVGTTVTLASSTLPVQGRTLAPWNTSIFDPEAGVHLHLEAEDTSGNIAVADADVVIDNVAPEAPTGLIATLAGVDAQTYWNPNTESDLLGYLLYRDNVLVNATSAFLPADLRPFALPNTQYLDKALPDGAHTYLVYAIDRAGNVSRPSNPAALDPVDNHPPSIRIEQPTSGTKFETSIAVLATSPDSDIAQVQFAWRVAGDGVWNDFGAALTSAPYRIVWIPPQGTPYGNYQIRALARDLGGQLDPVPPSVNVVYADLTAPDKLAHVVAQADAGTVYLTWNASTAADLAGYKVYRGFALLTATPVIAITYDDPGLDDADYTYTVTAVDAYGNESLPSDPATAHVFTITLQQPYSPLATPAVDIAGASARSGSIAVHVDTEAGSSNRNAGNTASNSTIALAAQPLAVGSNHLRVRVTDDTGDISRPAEVWVDRGDVPAAPTGTATAIADHAVHLAWNANAELDVLGYRVFRAGNAVVADVALSEGPIASTIGGNDPALAVDGNPQTAWQAYGVFADPDASPNDPALELAWGQAHVITAANLRWLSDEFASGNVDLYTWSGHAWIRVARVRGAAETMSSIVLTKPYRTDKVRLVVHGATVSGDLQLLQLAEIGFLERPVLSAASYDETVLDGTYRYQVTALSTFAFESPLSAEATAIVGDPQGDTAVVLSGSLIGNDASLNWTASASSAVVRYDLLRNGTLVHSNTSDVRAYVDAGLQNGTYSYVVIARDAVGNASPPSNMVTLTVSGVGPGVPTGLHVTAPPSGAELDEDWQAGTGTPPAYYVLRRAGSASGPYEKIVEPSATSYADKGLVNGATYWYTVEAVDAQGYASGPSVPVSGVPNDHLPPPSPLLTYPTAAPYPLASRAAQTSVCGVAEVGATVDIARDGTTSVSVIARANGSSNSVYVNGATRLLPAPDGRHVANVGSGGILNVQRIDEATATYGSNISTRLQRWAPHGLTLYYAATSTDEIFRWELGQPPQSVLHPFAQLSAFSLSADESSLAAAATYTDTLGATTNGVWLLAHNGTPRRIGTLDPVALSLEHPLMWSPDGRYLSVQDSDGTTYLVNGASAQIEATFSADPAPAPAWTTDATHLIYARANLQGTDEIVSFAADTRAQTILWQNVSLLHGLAWSPANDAFALMLDMRIEIRSSADATLRLAVDAGVTYPHLDWAAGGRIIANDGTNLRYVDLPGWFCTDAIGLHVGANGFSATALDGAGHRSLKSAQIEVDVPSDHLPDLAIGLGDILFLPPAGKPGQNYSALVTLHNLGTAAVDHPTLAARLTAPDGSQRVLTALSAPIALQAGGGVESLTFALGTLTQAGSYRLDVVADPDQQLHEIDEANNATSSALTLSADGKPVLELNLASTVFAPGVMVSGDVAVTNPGNTFGGKVGLSVFDASGALVANLADQNVRDLAFGQRWSAPVTWDAQGVFAGNYRLRAQLFGQDGSAIAERSAAFAIAVVRHLQLTLTPDATTLAGGATALLHSGVDFSDGNALLSGAALQLSALDSAGNEVWSTQQPLGTLLPGYTLARDDTWSTGGVAPGVYTLRLRLAAPDLMQSVETSVTLTAPAAGVALSGTLAFDPGTTLIAGESTMLHYSVTNAGNVSLANVQARVRLITAPGQVAVSEQDEQFDLAISANHAGSLALMAPPLLLIGHAAILQARLPGDPAGQWRLLAQQGFEVVDLLPPQITVMSPPSNIVQPAVVPLRAAIVDLHSAVAAAQVSIDAGSWQPISAGADGAYARGLSHLSDGPHTLTVRARDTWGNQAQSMAVPFTVDATPPAIIIAGVQDDDVVNHVLAPTVTISDAHLKESDVRLNGATFASGSSIDQDGSYVLTARASDEAENLTIASVRFTIDRSPPTVTITAPLDGVVVAQSAIEVDVLTEALANVTLITGAFQAQAVANAQGHVAFLAVPLALGANVLQATAVDRAGNAGAAATSTVTYQQSAIAPLTGTLQPITAEVAHGAPLDVSLVAQNPNGVTLPAQSLRITLRDAAQNLLANRTLAHDFAANETYSTLLSFASTSWSLGNVTLTLELDVSGTWTLLDTKQVALVDRAPPLVSIDAPLNGSVLHGPVVVHGTASDALSSIASVELRVDAGDWSALAVSSGDAYTSTALAMADADHQAELRAHDGAGNVATAGPVHFAVDSMAPLINIAGIADSDLLAHTVAPTIAVSDAHLSSSDVRLNGQLYVSGATIAASGDYRLDVTAADAAGNQSSQAVHFTLDLDAPIVTFTAPVPNAVLSVASVDVAGHTEPAGTVHFVAGSFSVDTTADTAGTFTIAGVPLQPGANLLTAHATDRAGNVGPDATLVVTYQTAGISGHFATLPTQVPRGATLDVPYSLHNTGTVDFAALPLRVELRTAVGANVALGDDFTSDLAAGADASGTRHLDTTSVQAGYYAAVLLADLPATPGPGGWRVLDSAPLQVILDPCRIGTDVIFADNFERGAPGRGDSIFCNGFEALLRGVGASKSSVGKQLLLAFGAAIEQLTPGAQLASRFVAHWHIPSGFFRPTGRIEELPHPWRQTVDPSVHSAMPDLLAGIPAALPASGERP